MKLRALLVPAFFCLSLMVAHAGSAQPLQPLDYEPEWLQQMYAEGWQKIEEGVLQRTADGGQLETFSYGAEGLQWVVEGYERKILFFEERYSQSPDEKLADLIQYLRNQVEILSGQALTAPSTEEINGEALPECVMEIGEPFASAYALESPRGVKADAHVSWHNDCGYLADTVAYAYAHAVEGTEDTTVTVLEPKTGENVESNVTAVAYGSTDCFSEAQAQLNVSALSIVKQASDQQSTCPLDVRTTVTGPPLVTTDFYGTNCADVTWTASANRGNGGYTYQWYIGTALQGTGPTLTKRYCGVDTTVTIKAVATDIEGWIDEGSFTTEVRHIGPVVASLSGPASVTTDSYTSACADVTWTASATGGHDGGYTYSWYLGTDTTVQGTGSTFTKNYCSTSGNMTAKVVARDPDGHTDDATFTTSLSHRGSIVATISGPTSFSTNSTTPCANVTWTASATGNGHSGITYQWYFGTALQGSGTTLTKQYCSASQTVSVKLVATASDGHSDTDTHSTTVTYTPPPTVSITGPTSVALASSTECKSLTWTANATGGTSGYTYSWYIGTSTTVQGTAATLTKTYCGPQTINVKVTVRDSAAQTANATRTTTLTYTPPPSPPTASITGPTAIALASSAECKTITWTASATGGTPGYTYSWYIGTGTTVQGTATTLTKTYCGPQTISVKVVVRDSAAQTDDATRTTELTYQPPTNNCPPFPCSPNTIDPYS